MIKRLNCDTVLSRFDSLQRLSQARQSAGRQTTKDTSINVDDGEEQRTTKDARYLSATDSMRSSGINFD